jgi:hypothetical protein
VISNAEVVCLHLLYRRFAYALRQDDVFFGKFIGLVDAPRSWMPQDQG